MDSQETAAIKQKIADLEKEEISISAAIEQQRQAIKWISIAVLLSVLGLVIIIGFFTLPIALYYSAKFQKKQRALQEQAFYLDEEIKSLTLSELFLNNSSVKIRLICSAKHGIFRTNLVFFHRMKNFLNHFHTRFCILTNFAQGGFSHCSILHLG